MPLMDKNNQLISVVGNVCPAGGSRARHTGGRYTVSVTTQPPPRHPARAREAGGGGGVSLDSLLPALFPAPAPAPRPPPAPSTAGRQPRGRGRGRTTVRRRRPKHVQLQASDRHGSGDVRYVSFFSGGPGAAGGRTWGYSYKLG